MGELRLVDSQHEIVLVGDFCILKTAAGDYWIEHRSGEGMSVPAERFEELIKEFYNAEF